MSNMKARHVALIADSCFSGDFLNPSRGITPTITNEYFKNAYSRVSRQVLTSGASESVPDESPFTRQLKLALEGNTAPYLDPLMLYNQIRLGVTKTTPLFGDLKDSGHQEGSSFLLFLKNNAGQGATSTAPGGEELTAKVKIAKVYGTATVETDTTGTLFLDGVSQGQIPVGSQATIENLVAGPHEIAMIYDDGEKSTQSVTIKNGKTSAVEFAHPVKGAPVASPAVSAQVPAAPPLQNTPPSLPLLDGGPLPAASIKIDGNFDDWKNIPPVAVGVQDAKDNLSINRVALAVDAEKLFIKLDIADTTPSSFFRPSNFKEGVDQVSYAVSMDNGEGTKSVTVRLFKNLQNNQQGWFVEIGVRERDIFRSSFGPFWITGSKGEFAMKGASAEVSVPLDKIKKLLSDLGPTTRYRVFGWTAKGWDNLSEIRQTDAGYFSFATANQAAPVAPTKSDGQPLALPSGGALPKASIKIDGNFDDWTNIPPVALGAREATGGRAISKVFLAVDSENFYIRIDVPDDTPSSFLHPHNFDESGPFYAMEINSGNTSKNLIVRLLHGWPFSGWGVELGFHEDGAFRLMDREGQFSMKGSSLEMAVPMAKIRSLLNDLGSTDRYGVFGLVGTGWRTVVELQKTPRGSFTFQ
jgi:hypothetical protein